MNTKGIQSLRELSHVMMLLSHICLEISLSNIYINLHKKIDLFKHVLSYIYNIKAVKYKIHYVYYF